MEFLVVLFPRRRRTKIDREFNGHTNEIIEIEGGPHTITLGHPQNFKPRSRRVDLRNTSAINPRVVSFQET